VRRKRDDGGGKARYGSRSGGIREVDMTVSLLEEKKRDKREHCLDGIVAFI
jgi:hypothetical protein